MLLTERPQPTHAKLFLWSKGGTVAGFARFHQRSLSWTKRVFDGTERAPDRFKEDLARYLNLPLEEVERLFPEEQRRAS